MYRINSISPNMITLQVVTEGKYHSVQLLPRNFVMSEVLTPQMDMLADNKAIRIREVRATKASAVGEKKVDKALVTVTTEKITEVKETVTTAPATQSGNKKK